MYLFLAPGFDSFCGFMHVENAHTHPVVLTFISLVQAEIIEKKRLVRNNSLEGVENGKMFYCIIILYSLE